MYENILLFLLGVSGITIRTIFKALFLHLKAGLLEEVSFQSLCLNHPRSPEQCIIILLMLPVVISIKDQEQTPAYTSDPTEAIQFHQ